MSSSRLYPPKHILNRWVRDRINPPASLDWQLDDVPSIFPGSAISGRVVLNIREDQLEVSDFTTIINLKKKQKQSFYKRCGICAEQNIQLSAQTLLPEPAVLTRGRHEFSFSISIPNDFPPSLNTSVIATTYELRAKACTYESKSSGAEKRLPTEVSLDRVVSVQPRPLEPMLPYYLSHTVSRTGICISTYFDPFLTMHQPNRVSIIIDGLKSLRQNGQESEVWRLMKGAWSIEETVKAFPQACERHKEQNLIQTNTTRLGGEELYDGWKDGERDGSINFNFDLGFKRGHKITSRFGYVNGLKSPLGFEVVHSLILELVFVLEHFSENQPEQMIRTGQARISQIPFKIFLSSNHEMDADLSRESLPSYNDV